jgi:hypothetical protein
MGDFTLAKALLKKADTMVIFSSGSVLFICKLSFFLIEVKHNIHQSFHNFCNLRTIFYINAILHPKNEFSSTDDVVPDG